MVGEKTKIRLMNRAELIAELERKVLSIEGKVTELKARLLQLEEETSGKPSKTGTPVESRKSSRNVSTDRSKGSKKGKKAFEEGIVTPGVLKKALERIKSKDGSGTDDDRIPDKQERQQRQPEFPEVIINAGDEGLVTPAKDSVKEKPRKIKEEFINPNDQHIQNLLEKSRSRRITKAQDRRSRAGSPTDQQNKTGRESSCARSNLQDIRRLYDGHEEQGTRDHDRDRPPSRQSDRRHWERYKQQFEKQDDKLEDEVRYRPSNNYLDLQQAEWKEIQRKEEQKRIRDRLNFEEDERYREQNRRFEAEERRRIRRRLDEELEIESQRIDDEEVRRFQDNLTRLRLDEQRRRRESYHPEDLSET